MDDYKDLYSRPFPTHVKPDPKGKKYWNEIQQWAVMEYKDSNSYDYRNHVFTKYLYEPIKHMAEAILGRYQIYKGRYTDEELSMMAITDLVEKFENFDEWKPTPVHKQINFSAFEEDIEMPVNIVIDSEGYISEFLIKEKGAPEGFVELMDQTIIGKIKTIYRDSIMDTRIMFRCAPKKKFVYFFTPTKDYNEPIAIKYYQDKTHGISDGEIESRVGRLRDYMYFEVEKERNSYSYCQTIIRNYYKNHSQKHHKKKLTKLSYAYAEQENDSMHTSGNVERKYYLDATGDRELFSDFLEYYASIVDHHKSNNPYFDDNKHMIAVALEEILKEWDDVVPDIDEHGEKIKDTARKNLFYMAICEYTNLDKAVVKDEMKYFIRMYNDVKRDFFKMHTE